MTVIVGTWNTLHRIHADNWQEPTIDNHPDERVRMTAIAERIASVLVPECGAICLQEVSGDQLVAIRAALPPHQELVSSVYPRIPRPFRAGTIAQLVDPTEHLVIISTARMRTVAGAAFASDPGKGYLAVELDGVVVINTHVSFGERRDDQCAELAELARRQTATVALVGDFNADRATILGALGPDFVAATLRDGSLPTRPRSKPSAKAQDIDHVVMLGARVAFDARVLSAEGLSDHNIVVARVGS